jgi:hypothetical protein
LKKRTKKLLSVGRVRTAAGATENQAATFRNIGVTLQPHFRRISPVKLVHRKTQETSVVKRILLGLCLSLAVVAPALAQNFAPPSDRYERPPPPPGPGERWVWEPGHWRWDGVRYVWDGGHYVERRPGYARYEPGHWVRRGGIWVWDPPHWR